MEMFVCGCVGFAYIQQHKQTFSHKGQKIKSIQQVVFLTFSFPLIHIIFWEELGLGEGYPYLYVTNVVGGARFFLWYR